MFKDVKVLVDKVEAGVPLPTQTTAPSTICILN